MKHARAELMTPNPHDIQDLHEVDEAQLHGVSGVSFEWIYWAKRGSAIPSIVMSRLAWAVQLLKRGR